MTTRVANALRRRMLFSHERDWDRLAILAVVLGSVLRVAWILFMHPPVDYVYSDMRGYVTRADNLATGGPLGPADAFYPPGTQMLLAIPLKIWGAGPGLWGAAIMWCALSCVTVWLCWRLARELLTPAAASLTAVLCAIWPLFITYGGFFTSETPALASLVASIWLGLLAIRQDSRVAIALALLAGLAGGAAVAIRPQLVFNVLILGVVVFVARKRALLLTCSIAGFAGVLVVIVMHNSIAAGQPTGFSTNGGLNFWFGHCDARQVTTFNAQGEQTGRFTHAVPDLTGRGENYVFQDANTWDDDFFYELGWECIQQDRQGHLLRLARNIIDMTATTVPFPQFQGGAWQRNVVQIANVLYSILLPWIVIESIFLIRRRRPLGGSGEMFLLLNFACVAFVAVLYLGDPRVRTVYDVFGLALLATLLTDRLHLDRSDTGLTRTARGRGE